MTDELEYWPTDIRRVRRGKRWIHIDPSTGKQTYPSWAKRSTEEQVPFNGGREPGDAEMADLHVLLTQLRNDGHDLKDGVLLTDAISALSGALSIKKSEARSRINNMWACDLFFVTGMLHSQSSRYMHKRIRFR